MPFYPYRRGHLPLGGNRRSDGGDEHSAAIDAGLVVNVNKRHGVSVGGSVYFGDEFARVGLRLGYRYYLVRWLAVDASAGVVFPRGDLSGAAERGTLARVELNVVDAIAVGVEATRFDLDGSGRQTAAFATVRVGWAPLGLAAWLALQLGK